MTKKELMIKAHQMTKEIKAEYPGVDYKFQLGLCLAYLHEEGEKEMSNQFGTYVKKSNLTGEELQVKDDMPQIADMGKYMKAAFDFGKNYNGYAPEIFENEDDFFRIVNKEEFKKYILWYESVSNDDDMKKSFYDCIVIAYDEGEEE